MLKKRDYRVAYFRKFVFPNNCVNKFIFELVICSSTALKNWSVYLFKQSLSVHFFYFTNQNTDSQQTHTDR